MKMNDVMILWNVADQAAKNPGKPQISVVLHAQNNRALNFLFKSVGACFNGWGRARPEHQAAHLLAIFTRAVGKDGVPREEAHAEFMKIDEYREWIEQDSGPFSDVYWRWSQREEAMA
jgi:hypothetical protein